MPDMNDYVYGVGFKLNADSLKQAKNDLKINLDALSKMVKSYGKVLKIDPNADLSKLFDEVKKVKGIVDSIDNSDVSFGNFVDKGTLSRIATLENGLKSISETSETVEASIADLRNAVSEVTSALKQAGSIKFPATFDNLFADKSQKANQLQVKVKQLESVMQHLKNSYKEFQDSSDQSLDENISLGEISTWIKEFQMLQKKIADVPETGRKLSELYADLLKISELGQKLNMVIGSSGGQDILKNLGLDLDSKDGIVFNEFLSSIPKQIEKLIADVTKQRNKLKQELNQLGSADLSSKAKRSLGVAANADGSNYTLRAKIIPDTDEVSWANTINDTIKNIEHRLSPVRLTPTFSNSSKNLQKEVDGNLAQINHAINVDLQVHDNLTQFNEKIQHIDASIKNAKQQLEKNGNFTIKFDYEEGGKFKDTAYQIINKFKKIDAHFYVANGKTFLKDIAGIKEKAKKEFKDIPITLAVGNKDKVLESVLDLRNDISKKVDNIGVNLNLQNVPQVIQQAAIMRDSIEQYYENNPIGNIAGPSGIDADANSASRSIVELSEKAKKAQEDVNKIKSALKSLTELGFKSPDFLNLGAFDKDGKHIKGSKEQIKQILQGYDELRAKVYASKEEIAATYGTGEAGYQAYQSDLNMLEQTENMLKQILQGQIQYSQKRLELAEQTLAKEKQVTQEKAKQTTKTVQDNAQSQTVQETKNNQQLSMSAEEAAKKVRSLNGTLSQQKKVLKDLDAHGINAASFTKLGEWDKDSKSFKKNSQEIQELLKKYKELQKARLAAGGTKAVGEEASLRGKLAAILKEQKKHVSEIIAANQSELASVKAIANAQKQARASKPDKQQSANTKAAVAEQDKLNKKIKQQQQILNDLNKKGWQSKYFAQLGTWDKETQKFKKNTTEMQILIKQYMDLKKAREDAGIKSPIAGSEELKLRGRIGALLKEQKKHISEIIAKNQEELKSAQKTADAYKQADAAKVDTDKKPVASAKGVEKTTNAVDELNASLEKAKQALNLLQSGKIDVVKSTGLGDISKRIDASGIKQSLNWIVNRYKILLSKKKEFEKAGATGSDEYVRNEKQIQIYEQLLTNIYQDQLKYTQSRIGQLETEIAKRKEILALQEQQSKADAAQQAKPKEQKQQQAKSDVAGEKKVTGQIPKDASSVVKLDGATLKSLAKDATLKSIDTKLSNILSGIKNINVEQKKDTSTDNIHYVTDEHGNPKYMYRGIHDAYGGLVSNRYHGGTFSTDNLALAKEYAGPSGKVEKVRLSMKNPLEIDGDGALWNQIQYIGNRSDETSKKLYELIEAVQFYNSEIERLKQISPNSKELELIQKGLLLPSDTSVGKDIKYWTQKRDKDQAEIDVIFADSNNPYGKKTTNEIVEIAKAQGYDGVIFKNIIDSATGQVKDMSTVMVTFTQDQIHYIETIQVTLEEAIQSFKSRFGDFIEYVNTTPEQVRRAIEKMSEMRKKLDSDDITDDEYNSFISSTPIVKDFDKFVDATGINPAYVENALTTGDVGILSDSFYDIVISKMRQESQKIAKAFNVPSDQLLNMNEPIATTGTPGDGFNQQIAASADKATKEQSELNAELTETTQKDGTTQGTINDSIAQDAERATQEQRELNSELENTQKLSSSVVTHDNMTGDVSKIVDTYKSDDKVDETQEIYSKVRHGKDNPPTFEHTATVTKTNMEAYNKLYKDYIKSLSKQLEIEQKIASTNGPTSKFQEDLKVQKEITAQLESQLQKHTDLFTEQSKQAAMAEATKNANQATATSNAKASDAAINKQINAINKAVESAQQTYRDMSTSVNELSASTASPIKEQFVEYERLLSKLKTAQQDIANNPQLLSDESYADGLKQLLSQIDKAENRFNVLNQSATEFAKNIRSANDIKIMDAKTFNAKNITQMHDEMRNFANAAGFGEAKLLGFNDANRTATFEVKNGQGQVQQLTVAYNQATNALGRYVSKTTEGTSRSQQFFDGLKKSFGNVARYLASFGSIYELFAVIRQGVTYVRDIDAALTELKKVTDETDASYDRFLQNMSKTAGVIGSTVSELTQMAAEWSRLGYSMKESAQLAESTAVLLNVSEFSDATEASEALISTMQAFQYTADESQHVVDILNEVGNNYAVSSDGLAVALQDSASSLMTAGASLEESVALIAAANKVVQDPNSVGKQYCRR